MDFTDLINQRQSTRKYSEKQVKRDLIDKCIEAARLAPSARNSQPWSFIVLDDPKQIASVSEKAFSGIYKSTQFAGKAPVLIVVVTEKADYVTRMGNLIRNIKYSLIDIGIACEHLVLQAEELGLGTCWLGWFSARGVRRALKLPRSAKIDILISMGYPLDPQYRKERKRRTLDEIRKFYSPDK
ncbi:nitroreductase family protein [bacterium]|nr:nitroreductase family protein [bacterium]MBU1063291.1 nitroreductase family protein [bacterium]MBU1632925.1 nitroreductase family protein [bacterium]MBU1873288.1 nitroreductase family protein [bacterium]